ncbi:peptide MFS transporter [Candidatus Viadribacter manganicus]|uniref:Amino acid transporter n=1 Tax=Candidatus Viadribacter manganicus TaxID=1759059 RepID=A0A1B1AJ82_9PROT|nr:MFS transporter [Candidatus Viadribacter manganicus]ANP46580.1 amino acid transporter [Candidatus Viadribacter manganicus]
MTTAFTPPAGKDILGHPRGLWYLVFAEAWERFSYYGMQALLVLYLTQYLLLPENVAHIAGFTEFKGAVAAAYGWLGQVFGIGDGGSELATPIATAAAITGVYSAGVYATPMIGGWIADRFLGRTMTVALGALFMVAGHFLMAFDVAFVGAIACLFIGVGLFKGNIASQVGELYGPDDLRRTTAYQTFLLGVQIAVIIAPIVTGFLGEKVAWHYGFGAAGVGMAVALVVYLSGRKYLPPEAPRGKAAQGAAPQPKLTGRDWMTMLVLIALLPILAATAIGNQEIFNAYLLWGEANYNLVFFGETMPVSWLVSLDAIISTITVGAALFFWTWWGKRWKEPDEIIKLAIGAVIAAGAPLILAFASANRAATGEPVSLIWGIGFHVVNDIGFAMIFPVGLALFSRAAPRQVGGLFIGIYYLHLFICNLATGKVAGMIETMDGFSFWAMHAAVIAAGAVALLVFAFLFHRLLAPTTETPAPA